MAKKTDTKKSTKKSPTTSSSKSTAKYKKNASSKSTAKKPTANKPAAGSKPAAKPATTPRAAVQKPAEKKPAPKPAKAANPAETPKTSNSKSSAKSTSTANSKSNTKQNKEQKKGKKNVGKVLRGNTKYIDPETKKQRNYVVVIDTGEKISVAKLKSIKIFDKDGKNADKALVEINATRYGLNERTGVDFQLFDKNRMSGKDLSIEDKDAFPEGKERFTLGSHDLHRTILHTHKTAKRKKGK